MLLDPIQSRKVGVSDGDFDDLPLAPDPLEQAHRAIIECTLLDGFFKLGASVIDRLPVRLSRGGLDIRPVPNDVERRHLKNDLLLEPLFNRNPQRIEDRLPQRAANLRRGRWLSKNTDNQRNRQNNTNDP